MENSNNKYDLLIVESPSKAKTIQKYLSGQNIKVIASVGHIKELPKKDLGIDLNTFEMDLQIIQGKEDVVKEIKKLAKEANTIYLGSDDDAEGCAISWHIREIIGGSKKNIKRVLFHEVTKEAIKEALKNPTDISQKLYEAQKTRRILDRLVGYKISPLLWDKLGSGLSAGRVQSSALRLIVDREREILNFIPDRFFQITAKLKKDEIVFESKYFGEKIDKKNELKNEEIAKQIFSEINDKDFIVEKVETKEKKQNPSAPFTTSRLQQESSNKLRFSSKKTMEIAQKLYDGSISLGEKGGQGLITYMRTDSVRINPEFQNKTKSFLLEKYGQEYIPSNFNVFKSKNATAQDAHEAIRPTNLENNPESIRQYLSEDEYELYKLIWNKYISSQMSSAILDTTTVMFNVNEHFFKSSGTVIKFDGFRKVYLDEDERKKDEEENDSLPKLNKDDKLTPIEKPKLLEKFTSPPPRYTEASLIKTLEELGIGRPSTYSAIISNISDRKYVEKKELKFYPSEIGLKLSDFLVQHFIRESDYNFTAKMEEQLDEIEGGKIIYTDVLKDFWHNLSKTLDIKQKELENLKKEHIPRSIDEKSKTGISCEKCDGEYILKKGKGSEFLGCSNYPTCKSTKNYKKDKKGTIKIEEKKITYHLNPCPNCGKKLILRDGKFGKFYSCEGYKDGCKKTLPVTTGIKCPDCNIGEFVKKKSPKMDSEFYGCSNFPNCKNIINFKPIDTQCPKCNYPVVGIKKRKDNKVEVHCTKCKKITEV